MVAAVTAEIVVIVVIVVDAEITDRKEKTVVKAVVIGEILVERNVAGIGVKIAEANVRDVSVSTALKVLVTVVIDPIAVPQEVTDMAAVRKAETAMAASVATATEVDAAAAKNPKEPQSLKALRKDANN